MASYHMCCKVISRGQGRSATAAAAYRAAERILDRRTGIEHDYSRKQGVVRSEVLLPRDAPELYRDRGELWNAVEAAEHRRNSQLAREYELALPRELGHDEQFDLARGWAERELVSRGMCADVCMHDRGDGNPHAHIMCTTREAGPDGFGAKNRDWNDKALLVDMRKSWERDQNAALERAYERDHTPERERMRRNVERVRDMASDMDGRGAGITREAREAYDGLSRRERRMLHKACPRGLSPTIDRLSADRHARKPLVERSVERERERASADRETGRGRSTGGGGRPMRRRDYERAVDHEKRSRYMEHEQNRALERHYERERCAAECREYAPAIDRARENEQIMERNALVERPSGII